MNRTHAFRCMTLTVLLAIAVWAPPAFAQDDEAPTKSYHFEFAFDADSLLEDLAVHFDPPDFSALEELRFRFDEPLEFFALGDPSERIEEQMEVARLERDSRELAQKALEAEGAERERLESELQSKLQDVFEAKLELRRERIGRLEEKLRTERENLRARERAREDMIQRRFEELMGEDETLDW